jgi:hypothetical protein
LVGFCALSLEFSSRHIQLEMFYAGVRFVSCGYTYSTFDRAAADALDDLALKGSDS